MTLLAPTLEAFFTERLMTQREASPHTISGYRDTMRLLLRFASNGAGKTTITARALRPRRPADQRIPRPPRKRPPQHSPHSQRPSRGDPFPISLRRLQAPRARRGDRAGARAPSKTVRPRADQLPHRRRGQGAPRRAGPQHLDRPARPRAAADCDPDRAARLRADRASLPGHTSVSGAHLHCRGKNRKERVVPLIPRTIKALTVWLKERQGLPEDPLFPSNRGRPLSRDAVEWLIAKHANVAAARCPTLRAKRVTAHALRHTTAMTLLQSDISTTVIALWLGHEQESTTRGYLHGDLRLKQRAIDRTAPRHQARSIPTH